MKSCSMKFKLFAIVGVGWLALLITAYFGLNGLRHTVHELDDMYHENVINSQRVASMNDLLLQTRVQLLLSLQHEPTSEFAKLHDHPLNVHLEQVSRNLAAFAKLEQEYKRGILSEKERSLQEDFLKKSAMLINDGFQPVLQLITAGNYHDAARQTLQKINPLFKPAGDAAEAIYKNELAEARQAYEDGFGYYRTAVFAVGLSVIVSLLVMGIGGWAIIRSVKGVASRLSATAAGMAAGNLTLRTRLDCDDELGSIGQSFDQMADTFSGFIGSTQLAVLKLADSAKHFSSTSARSAHRVEGVAAQALGVATASEEMAATSGDIAQNCMLAADGAGIANDSAQNGAQVVQETIAGMQRIAERVHSAAQTVEALGARSDQIGAIVGTIEDIADQTNLLALNAAIEAARAGEMGRGFAVVADEVRALAERTTRATREISEMIKAIQQETRGAVASMEEGVREVEQGTIGAARSGDALQDIINQIQNVSMQISQIATAAEEQTATTGEIATNIHQINATAGTLAAESSDGARQAEGLSVLADDLEAQVRRFKTAESDLFILEIAKGDHRKFVDGVEDVLLGAKLMEPGQLSTHKTCRFGKWYDGEGQASCGCLTAYRDIAVPHERIHSMAREAVSAYNAGDQQKADGILREMKTVSGQIVQLLDRMGQEARSQRC